MFLGIRNDELLELIETVHTKYYWVSEIKSISNYTDIFIRLCKKHYESCNDWANCDMCRKFYKTLPEKKDIELKLH